ncbi:hypothetical protein GGI59_005551 [Rhizobium lentis]|uniref:Uncharacterized protein n=1 Tax=Rhizobium lentis TaxID=1138194 RepID=A0A7W8XJ75_9HYPH|nr:hypothetical protein [Rhizobium lentis]MBB5553888.1 hypothetical protein [Rhizobium lentis]MBB5563852.1 hypothetical protein [Rhizobium lentis]MBB5570880.1 hypothetical protein [Rhizobium lentis]
MAIGKSFATHENVKHSSREFVRDAAHVNSVGGFKSRVRRTIAGVFHHIISAPSMPCLSTRSASAGHSALLRARQCGYWSRVPPALRLLQVFRAITGRQCAEVRMPGLSLNLPVFCDKAALFSGSQQRVRRRSADLTGAAIGDSCHYPGIGGPINPTIEEIIRFSRRNRLARHRRPSALIANPCRSPHQARTSSLENGSSLHLSKDRRCRYGLRRSCAIAAH